MSADQEQERQRLVGLYAGMSDEELAAVWQDSGELTDLAKQALQAELDRRGLVLNPPDSGTDVAEWDDLVVIGQFRDLYEALLARGVVDSAGIECVLVDDNTLRLSWYVSNLVGGVKLCVHAEDADAAFDLLHVPIPANLEVDGVGKYEQPTCPSCQSLDISYETLHKGASYASAWLINIPVPVPRKRWKCNQCGNTWKESAAEA